MTKVKVSKLSLEEEIKTLQKHMGAVLATIKDLKQTVEALGKRVSKNENEEIKEIIETQRVIDEVIVANSDSIKRIMKEMEEIHEAKSVTEVSIDGGGKGSSEKAGVEVRKKKRCRYFNRGYCKYNSKCRFVHPKSICNEHLLNQKCENGECNQRHPKKCKWESNKEGCKRKSECAYIHGTPTCNEQRMETDLSVYQCAGCKDIWNNKTCMVEHMVNNTRVVFCLNCSDWIRDKEAIFDEGWSLLDEAGFLRQDI